MIIESLNDFIRNGACKRMTIHYDTSAINIRLYGVADEEVYNGGEYELKVTN